MNGISVIIPNYNGAAIIGDCLRALYKQQGVQFEIIVVDDCSTDDSLDMLKRLDKKGKIKLVQNRVNQGYAASCHAGTRVSNFSNLLFLNSDAYIKQEDALALMVQKFAADPDLGVLGCRQFNVDGTPQFFGSNVDVFLNINSVNRYFDLDETGTYDCMMTGGAAFAVRKSVYQQLGGIDTTYYLYVEELDLMWRARLLGYKVTTFGDISVVHLGGSSTGNAYNNTTNVKKMYFRERNALFTMLKNYQIASLIVIIPVYMIFQSGEILAMILMRRTDAAKLYYRAWSDVLKRRSELHGKRSAVQKLRKVSDFRLYRDGYVRMTNYKVHQVIKKGVPKIGA